MQRTIDWVERGRVPLFLVHWGIDRLIRQRLREMPQTDVACEEHMCTMLEYLRRSPIAIETDKANEQHYEVPATFFQRVLGEHLKYSSAYWNAHTSSLSEAEAEMLAQTCNFAEVQNGMQILELGCGWGSLTLWMAHHYREAQITAVSNSQSQREFIEEQCRLRQLHNVKVLTHNVVELDLNKRFDRVVSIEMFEHLRNYHEMLARISSWLHDKGKLFLHVFCHRKVPYLFETDGDDNWMGRYFFTGGMMPSFDLLPRFQDHLSLEEKRFINGSHYARTAAAWCQQLEAQRSELIEVLADTYGPGTASIWYQRWKLFFLACERLFAWNQGREWGVAHYRFLKDS